MYKMKEVCEATGLTEKTVRFYMEQKLVEPKMERGLHYRSYTFSDGDIQRLLDISALRSADFSVTEIRRMLENADSIPGMVADKEKALAQKINAMQSARSALKNLTIHEQTDLGQVADAIEPRSVLRKETPKNSRNRLLWLGVYVGIFLVMCISTNFKGSVFVTATALLLLTGIYFPIMALGYFRYNRRRLPNRGRGTVVSVITDEGVGDYWESSTWETVYGLMNLGFLHWNWVRPDHWVPLIQFEAEGRTVTAAYRYGWLQKSWKPGQTVEIGWQTGKEQQIYPIRDPILARKAWFHLLTGMAAMGSAVAVVTGLLLGFGG